MGLPVRGVSRKKLKKLIKFRSSGDSFTEQFTERLLEFMIEMKKENVLIRSMQEKDREEVLAMMQVFYASDAVINKANDEILQKDISDCVGDCPYVDGYVFEVEGEIAGYGIAATGYSTEFGGVCIWLEDLYMKEQYRGHGIGRKFFEAVEEIYGEKAVRFRLEVEKENEGAIALYEKMGYHFSTYDEMSKEI